MTSVRLREALDQIVSVRAYTSSLLDTVDPSFWFRMPAGGVTHVAWQVGHLAVAQYRLTLERTRGTRPGDDALLPPGFPQKFGYGSIPQADSGVYPSASDIHDVFNRVHKHVLEEVAGFPDALLDEPPSPPHPLFSTKIGSLRWCALHEMLHAGQIGLLRRMLGLAPAR